MNATSPLATSGAESELRELLVLLWRHKWAVVASALLCGGLAVWKAMTATLLYRAEATITEVDNRQLGAAASLAGQFGGLASLVGVNLGGIGNGARESQALLKSRRLAEEFVSRNKLIPVLYPPPKVPPSLWMTVKEFREQVLEVREDKRAGLTVVTVTWSDPEVAANWANQYVALANELLRARAITESQASIAYLNRHLATVNEVEVRKVMYGLIENETKTLMLANVRAEYALSVVDPAVAPELRFSPKRTLMVAIGTLLGGVLGIIFVLGWHILRRAGVA